MSQDESAPGRQPGTPAEIIWTLSGQDILWRNAEEALFLDLRTGAFYGMRGVGLRVWRMLGQGATVREIRSAVLSEYAGDLTRCDADVKTFLLELVGRGLIVVHGRREPSASGGLEGSIT